MAKLTIIVDDDERFVELFSNFGATKRLIEGGVTKTEAARSLLNGMLAEESREMADLIVAIEE